MPKLEVATLGNPRDATTLHYFAQSPCGMILLTKLGSKNELASLLSKTLLDRDDALVKKTQVPLKYAKSSCSNENGAF